ncbi:flavodoxin family protein [Amycolatopsis panacis]|uniref:Flavodoxin family protein n=1 Tax=Amycolatopsis panacis TaxID=2340917 RepID=A0A419I6V8_9PSEU|nr:flavodoxin domain-containing protein [Amycolatopsis panacis]RJQ87280.1 flavodoxin family protein [Amycolatopsis panacis]
MRAIVVYESMFGNTEEVAYAVGEGCGASEVFAVNQAPGDLRGYDLLVVGAPTHVHGLSRPSTRKAAAEQEQGGARTGEPGLREWLGAFAALPPALETAVFDTRIGKPRWLTGSAARSAAKILRDLGRAPAEVESFLVEGDGPDTKLVAGEATRARDWGAGLRLRRRASRA